MSVPPGIVAGAKSPESTPARVPFTSASTKSNKKIGS